MQVRILGCSGGIGQGLKTTCLLLDESVLIDAGTGLESLTQEELCRIRRVCLTHAHLDHVACLPLMLASVFGQTELPVEVHAHPVCLEALHTHLFNWTIWPDYTQLPTPEQPTLTLHPLAPGQTLTLDNARLQPLAVNHPTPTQGYLISTARGALAFTGDTTRTPAFWAQLAKVDNLRHVLVDVSFPNGEQAVADASGHYTPQQLAEDLATFPLRPQLHITHLKPGFEAPIMAECHAALPGWPIRQLRAGDRMRV